MTTIFQSGVTLYQILSNWSEFVLKHSILLQCFCCITYIFSIHLNNISDLLTMYRTGVSILIVINFVHVKSSDDYWLDSFDLNKNCDREDEVIINNIKLFFILDYILFYYYYYYYYYYWCMDLYDLYHILYYYIYTMYIVY